MQGSLLAGQEASESAASGGNGEDDEATDWKRANPSSADEQRGRAGRDQRQSEAVRGALARASGQPVPDRYSTVLAGPAADINPRSRGVGVVEMSEPVALRQHLQHAVGNDGQLASRQPQHVPHGAQFRVRSREESLRERRHAEAKERPCQSDYLSRGDNQTVGASEIHSHGSVRETERRGGYLGDRRTR